ncbi:lysine--tRNA ligase [Archaeoglobales archaeon]|nr:MAG: lysine--tRNA ligase [Archaeoglobales archaeon]
MHWADVVASELLRKSREHKIATGISPSGHIHLGNLREMLTADAIRRALLDIGGQAEIVYIADDFDPLRKRYPFLPKKYEEYIGMPLCKIPDPEGCHDNYADHFLEPFLQSLEILRIPIKIYRAFEMYKTGFYRESILTALRKRDTIAKIIKEVTGREVEDSWFPFMPLCNSCYRINSTKVVEFDENWIYYRCKFCGDEGRVRYNGGGKLTWRVDWAARWKILGITCEPFGKDHAAAGGSYDTGKRIAEEVFNYPPPYPIPYEWVHLKGVGAMKSSKGIVIPVKEMLEILPPEIVRYVIIRVRPERHIEFDPGMSLLDVIDEFEDKFRGKDRSVELSLVENVEYSDVPFRHLIVVGQIANWDIGKALEILERTGYVIDDVTRRDVERRIIYAKRWLERYGPERIKFQIASQISSKFSQDEKEFLKCYSERLKEGMSPEEIHTLVYEVSRSIGVKPSKAFQAIYKAILDKEFGPRVGYFLKSLGIDWVKSRFKVIYEEN